MKEIIPASLRLAVPEDCAQLAHLEQEIQRSPWSENAFRGELDLPNSQILLVTDDETDEIILGYVVVRKHSDFNEVLNLGVGFSHRGLGWGTVLMRKVVSDSVRENKKRVVLDVRKTNEAAIQLYQKLRFDTVRIKRAFYTDGEDAMVMELSLDDKVVPLD